MKSQSGEYRQTQKNAPEPKQRVFKLTYFISNLTQKRWLSINQKNAEYPH